MHFQKRFLLFCTIMLSLCSGIFGCKGIDSVSVRPEVEMADDVPLHLDGMVQMTLHSENANGVFSTPLKFMLRIGTKDGRAVVETFETDGGETLHGLADKVIARLQAHALDLFFAESRPSSQHASIILENIQSLEGKMFDGCRGLGLSFAVDPDVDTTELFPGEENVNINVSRRNRGWISNMILLHESRRPPRQFHAAHGGGHNAGLARGPWPHLP